MNVTSCGMCKRYDPVNRTAAVVSGLGRCVARSIYPAGLSAPAGTRRAKTGQVPRIEIVAQDDVYVDCVHARERS